MSAPAQRWSVWWLNPFWILAVPLTLLSLAALAIPEADYQFYWRMPKVFAARDLALCLWVVSAYSAGCVIAVMLDRALALPRAGGGAGAAMPRSWPSLTLLFHAGLVITAMAYAIWFALILKQTGPGILISVLKGDEGAIYELIRLRKDAAITGVTSLTQTGIGVGLAGVFLGCQTGWRGVAWQLAFLFFLTFMRAIFLAERLALLELALPGMLLWLCLRGRMIRRRWIVQLAPVAGVAALYFLFTFSEYFRSWGYYSSQGETSLLWFTLARLSGYYVTSLNNGALLWQELGPLYFPYATLEWLWRFPVIGGPLRDLCGGSDAPAAAASVIVAEEGNPEFNNPTGIFVTFTDLGVPGAMVFWVFFGATVMLLYRACRRGSIAGLFAYPFVFMGLTDQIRIFYLTGGRTFAAWLFLIAAIIVARREMARASLPGRRFITPPPTEPARSSAPPRSNTSREGARAGPRRASGAR